MPDVIHLPDSWTCPQGHRGNRFEDCTTCGAERPFVTDIGLAREAAYERILRDLSAAGAPIGDGNEESAVAPLIAAWRAADKERCLLRERVQRDAELAQRLFDRCELLTREASRG